MYMAQATTPQPTVIGDLVETDTDGSGAKNAPPCLRAISLKRWLQPWNSAVTDR